MKEKDLFIYVKDLMLRRGLNNVYGEVMEIDLVAHKDVAEGSRIVPTAVEMKLNLNFKVIEQAVRASKFCNFSYIAVPARKTVNYKFIYNNVLKPNNIGLILIEDNPFYNTNKDKESMKEMESVVGNRDKYAYIYGECKYLAVEEKNLKLLIDDIKEYSHLNVGGTKSGDNITDYSFTMEKIKNYLKSKDGWVYIDEIVENVSTHYKNPKESLIRTLNQDWNSDWVMGVNSGDGWRYIYLDKINTKKTY